MKGLRYSLFSKVCLTIILLLLFSKTSLRNMFFSLNLDRSYLVAPVKIFFSFFVMLFPFFSCSVSYWKS